MYYVDVKHDGLKKFRRIQGTDKYVVEQRANAQKANWDEQWARRYEIEQKRNAQLREIERKRSEQQERAERFESKKAKAIRQTAAAQEHIERLRNLLASGIKQEASFDWEALYNRRLFEEHKPTAPLPNVPARRPLPPQPLKPVRFTVPSSFLSRLFPSIQRRRELKAELLFKEANANWQNAHASWETAVEEAKSQYEADCRASQLWYEKECEVYRLELNKWGARKLAFEGAREADNVKVDAFRARYEAKNTDAIKEYIDLILDRSDFPEFFPKQWEMDFTTETGVLIVDYELPPIDSFPVLKAIKYIQVRDALEASFLKENEVAQIYDTAMYQTCLRALHEIFESDVVDAIKAVTLNGWVNFIDKANGKPARSCIMSVQTMKKTFQQINLSAVDPKTCFRSLKGVGSAKLAGMAAVVPILRLNRNDDRFVPAHDAIGDIGETTNVAAISWEEFEYLVRDIFEKEFSAHGGEVKITRASRDHGVDAIAFDPDPIRGGKIVIQAKRYTNVVGVSAVRDLYGTLINEGANRGILVTTSQYGPDSYEFAKDKPITLLDGGNLLSLLDKHGHKARIDLAEAKKLGAARDER